MLTLPGCGAAVPGGLEFAFNGASVSQIRQQMEKKNVSRRTNYVSEGRNGADDSDSTRLFNTARPRSTPSGALYGISLYSFPAEFCRLPLIPPALEIKMLFSPPRASLPVIIRRSRGATKKKKDGRRRRRARSRLTGCNSSLALALSFLFLFFLVS